MKMTYPIQPRSFFWAAPNWGKPAKHSLPQNFLNRTDVLLSALLLAAASWYHEESHLIYEPLESILLDQRFPVAYELDEFNPPYTGTTLSRLQLSTAMCNFTQTSSHFIPGQHFLETSMLLSPNDQDYTLMGDYIIHVPKQQTRPLLTYRCTFRSGI